MEEIEDKAEQLKASASESVARREEAAKKIQQSWRKRHNNIREHLDSNKRWQDAAMHAKLKLHRINQDKGKNTPKERWKRAGFFAARLKERNPVLEDIGIQDNDNTMEQKQLETQHWLELVDAKHRYGSNCCFYHRRWQDDDTSENFFKWLDRGGGKDLSLDQCPREQLEKERITYLSAEQRLNYLVKISDDGKLLWARNGEPVDTSAGHWKDSGNGGGVIPQEMPSRDAVNRMGSFNSAITPLTSGSSSEEENEALHYMGETKGKYSWIRAFKRNFTMKGLSNRMLRKTVQRNTWIYVTDNNYNIFIGIKATGTFQHSSFLGGGVVTSAGLISVHKGLVHTLSPLSGHYRTTVDHFHHFVDMLNERGVDMHRAEISKAEVALWGIEHLAKGKKKKDEFVKSRKDDVVNAAHAVVNWKRAVLEGRRNRKRSQTEIEQDQDPGRAPGPEK